MRRIHLFEFEDLAWFPDTIRTGGTDYLRYFLNAVNFYGPVIPLITQTLERNGQSAIIDLCSGGGGAIEQIYEGIYQKHPGISVTLTDKFPNTKAYQHLETTYNNRIRFQKNPVDATQVPSDLKGVRTLFSAIHHFPPATVKTILRDAVKSGSPICIFDGGDKNILTILGIILFHPIAFFLCTPFFKPVTFPRFFFTYLVPLIPLTTVWDGCISILRLYKPNELLSLAKEFDTFTWESGKVKNKLGMHITYLIGSPK